MKKGLRKIIAAVVAFLLIMIPVATIAGYHAKNDVKKHLEKVSTTELTRKPEYTTIAEPTEKEEANLYQEVPIEVNSLPITFSAPVKTAFFGYVPYEEVTEDDINFYTVLQVEVDSNSEDLEIYFKGSEMVFPINRPKAVLNGETNAHTSAVYDLDTAKNSATMNGFEAGISKIEIILPIRDEATVKIQIGDEVYEVTSLQIVF